MKEQDWFLETLFFQQMSPSVLKRIVNVHVLLQYITFIEITPISIRTAQNKTGFL
jgi:hypothetical protein